MGFLFGLLASQLTDVNNILSPKAMLAILAPLL
jgi:hypothetical protein